MLHWIRVDINTQFGLQRIDQVPDDNEDNAKLDNDQEAPTPMNASKDIAASISHILVRPQVESTLNLHDRHPYRLVRDLIKHYDTIFSEQSVQSHENHIHRRAIGATSPTSPDNNTSLDDDNNNDFSGSSAASSSGSSVLLSTPTTNTNFTHDTDEPLKSPTSPRSGSKRNLLSFMRRSSSTATSSSSSDRTPTTSSIPTASSTPRRPIPMPSKSTLFEDPDGDDDDDEASRTRPSNDDRTSLSTEDQPMKNMTSDKALPPVPSSETSSAKDEQGDNVTTTPLPDTTNKEPISMEKEEEEDKPPLQQHHHSRMSSVGTFQGSLDSFFKDDDL